MESGEAHILAKHVIFATGLGSLPKRLHTHVVRQFQAPGKINYLTY